MKEKNLSLARKILLALLAVLVAVGAFFGVITMNRNGVGNTVEGALSASAAEKPATKDALKTAVDDLCKELSTGVGLRTQALLTEAANALKAEIDATNEGTEGFATLQVSYSERLNLALQKGLAIEDLVSAYKAVTGKDLPIAADGFTVTNEDEDALLTTMQDAITAIKDANSLQGQHIVNVNDTLKNAVLGLLAKGIVWSDDDSAAVKAYIENVTDNVEKATAENDDTRIDVLTPVTETMVDEESETETADSVSAKLTSLREAEKNDAIDQYKAIVHLLLGTALDNVQVPDALTNAANCKAVNAALKAALDALLTPATGEDAPAISDALKAHYAALKSSIDEAIPEGKVDAVASVYDGVLTAEQKRFSNSEAESQGSKELALANFATYYEELGLTDMDNNAQYKALATTLNGDQTAEPATNGITLAKGDSIVDKLAAVNTALKEAVVGVLNGLYNEATDSAATKAYIDSIVALVNAAAEKPNDYTGLSDYENLKAATEGEKPEPAVTLSGVKAELEGMRTGELTAARDAYKAYYKTLKGSDYPTDDSTLGDLKVEKITNLVTVEGQDEPQDGGISAINTSLAKTAKALVHSLLSVENSKNLDSKEFADIISKYEGSIEGDALTAANNGKSAYVTTLNGTINDLKGELDTQRATELNNAKTTVVNAYNALFGTNYTYAADLTVNEKDNALTTALGNINGTTLSALNIAVKGAIDTFISNLTTDVANLGDTEKNAATKAVGDALTAANDTEANTYPTAYSFDSVEEALTALRAAVLLQQKKNESLESLNKLNGTLSGEPYSAYLTEDTAEDLVVKGTKTKLKEAYDAAVTAINGATTIGDVESALNDGVTNMLTAAAEAVAAVEFSESYKAIYGADNAGHDEALNAFKETIQGKTPAEINASLKDQLAGAQGLIAKAATEPVANGYVATLIGKLQGLVNNLGKEDGKDANAQIFDYSSVLVGAKEQLDVAKAMDTAIANIESHLAGLAAKYYTKGLAEPNETKVRMSEEDWTALSTTGLTNAKELFVNEVELQEEGVVDWDAYSKAILAAIPSKQADATFTLDMAAWKAVAKFELTLTLQNLNLSGSTASLEKALGEIAARTDTFTISAVNTTLVTAVKEAIEASLVDQSAATMGLAKAAFESLKTEDEDILAISQDSVWTNLGGSGEGSFAAQLAKERSVSFNVYKAYYKAIIGEDYTQEKYGNSEGDLDGAVNCAQINRILKKGIDDLFNEILTGKYASSSATVKSYITDAKAEVDTKIAEADKAATRYVFGSTDAEDVTVESKTGKLLTDIGGALSTEQTNAVEALKAFYNALKEGLQEKESEEKLNDQALLDALKEILNTYTGEGIEEDTESLKKQENCTALNNTLKEAMEALLDKYTEADTTDEIKNIVSEIKESIATYINGLNTEDAETKNVIELATSAKLTKFGQEANARIRIERERADAIAKLTTAYNNATRKETFTNGISEITVEATKYVEDMRDDAYEAVNDAAEALNPTTGSEASAIDEVTPDWTTLYSTAHDAIAGELAKDLPAGEGTVDAFEQTCRVLTAINVYIKSNRIILNDPEKSFEGQISTLVPEFDKSMTYEDINKKLIEKVYTDIQGLKNEDGDTTRVAKAIEDAKSTLEALSKSDQVVDITDTVNTIMNGEEEGKEGINTIRTEEKNAVKQAYLDAYYDLTGHNTRYTLNSDGTLPDTVSEDVKAAIAEIDKATDCKSANDALKVQLQKLLNEGILNTAKDPQEVKDYITKVVTAVGTLIDSVNAAGERRAPVFYVAESETTPAPEIDKLTIDGAQKTFADVKAQIDSLRLGERKVAVEEYIAAYQASLATNATGKNYVYTVEHNEQNVIIVRAKNGEAVVEQLPAEITNFVATINNTTYAADADKSLKDAVVTLIGSLAKDGDSATVTGLIKTAKTSVSEVEADATKGISDLDSIVSTLVGAIQTQKNAENAAVVDEFKSAYKAITGNDIEVAEDGKLTVAGDEVTLEGFDAFLAAASIAAKNEALKTVLSKLINKNQTLKVDDKVYDADKDAPEIVTYLGTADKLLGDALAAPGDNGVSNYTAKITEIKTQISTYRTEEANAAVGQYESIYKLLNGETATPDATVSSRIRGMGYAAEMNAALKTAVKALLEGYVDAEIDSKAVQDVAKGYNKVIDAEGAGANGIVELLKVTVNEGDTPSTVYSGTVADAWKTIEALKPAEILAAKNAYLAVVNAFAGTAYALKADGSLDLKADETAPDFITTALNAINTAANTKAAIDALKEQVGTFLTTYFKDKDSKDVNDYLALLFTGITASIDGNYNADATRAVPDFALYTDAEQKVTTRFGDCVNTFYSMVKADNASVQENFVANLKLLTGLELTDLTAELQAKYAEIAEAKTLADANTAAANLMIEVVKAYVWHTRTIGEGQDAKVELLDSAAYTEIAGDLPKYIGDAKDNANGETLVTILDLTELFTEAKESLEKVWNGEIAAAKASYLYVYNTLNGLSGENAVKADAEAVKAAIEAIEAAKNASELNEAVFTQINALLDKLAEPESNNTKAYFTLVKGHGVIEGEGDEEDTPASGLVALLASVNGENRTIIDCEHATFTVGEDEDQTFAKVYEHLEADRIAARKAAAEEFVEAYNATLETPVEYTVTITDGKVVITVTEDADAQLPETLSSFVTAINAAKTANEANTVLKTAVKALIGAFAEEGDSKAVSDAIAKYQGMVDALDAQDNGISDLTVEEENLVVTAKAEIEADRAEQRQAVKDAYLAAYNAILGTDEGIAYDDLDAAESFAEAIEALHTAINALLESAKIVGDSTKVEGYFTAAKAAVDAAFEESGLVVPELTEALQIEGKVFHEALSGQRDAEKAAAVDEYKAAYKLFKGADCAETDEVIKINEAESTADANAALIEGVKALLADYVDATVDSKDVQDLVTTHTANIEAAEPQENGICELINVAEDGTATGILATAKKAIDDERANERAAAVAQYKAAYKAVMGEDYTETEGDVVSEINATTNATDANKLLVAATLELLQNDLSEGDSKTVRDYLVENGEAEKLFNDAAGTNGISVLTAESGKPPLTVARAQIVALRAADVDAAMDSFEFAYVLLLGSADTDALFNEAAANHADTEILDAKFALEVLKDLLGNVIATTVTHTGDSASVKAYLTSVKEAVEAYLDLVIEAIDEKAIPEFTGENAAVLTVDDEEVTLADVKAALEEMRAEERAAAQETYKEYYEVVKGSAYDEATATDAEKKVLEDLGKAADNAALNDLLKSAVNALIDAYTKGDATTVTTVAAAQKAALGSKFDAATEEGALADKLAADIARALDEINFRRHQDETIEKINEAYDALAQGRMEAGSKTELETLKTAAIEEINKAELGDKTLAIGNAGLDDMLTDAIDSFNRKEAEGIAKQEYLDSYKALLGKAADTADATVKAALDAIAEAAKADKGYVSVVNAALKNAVNAALDSLLLRDDRNVLIDSQDVKAVVEAAKKNVETLTQNANEVPEVSDTLTGIKAQIEEVREAEKAHASEAVDGVVDSITGDKTYPADVQKQIDELVEAAKDQIADADYAEIVLIQNKLKAQIELLDALHAYEAKAATDGVATESVKAIIDAAIEEIGAANGASAVEKAEKAALLNADKAYAKLYLAKLVSAESDTVKAILTGSNGFNAKVEGASSAEEIEAIIAEAKIAIESVKFVDTYDILRKAFGSITADDKTALEAARDAFNGLKNSEVKDYLNKTSEYSSMLKQIDDMLNKAAFEAKKSETVAAAKALAEGKEGKIIADMLERQLHSINDIWYEAHYNDDRDAYLKQQLDALDAELTATGDVIKHAETVQNTANKMEEALGEYLTSGVYSGQTARNLRSIIDKYIEQAKNVSTSGSVEENLQEIYNQAIAELKAAPTWAVTAGEITANGTTDDYAEDYEGTTLWGYVTNDEGIEGGVTLSIETKDSTATIEAIQNGTLKAAAGSNLTEEEMKAIVENKDVISTFDISLLKQNAKVETFNGLYKVTVLLPEALRDIDGIEVVYMGANGEVEVYNAEVSEDGRYLTFTTEHFSEFVILGEATVNLWWLVITLTVVLGLELVALLVVLLKKGGKKEEKVASVLPLGLLLAVLPMNATGICVMLGVGVVALGVGIFFAARHKKS